jgi:hypothetical protein
MRLAQDNDVVHTFTPDRSDQPFGKAILPRRGWRGRPVPDAHSAQSASNDAAIDPIPIADEVARRLIPRKSLGDLTRNPFGRRIYCDVDPDKVPAVEPDDDEGIEQVETDSWNHEQVHGGNVRRVVAQERSPSLAGRRPSFDHVLGDARLRDLKPELEQFAVEAWRSPKRVLDIHPPDQRTQIGLDLWPPSPSARLPTAVAAKARPVPTHKGQGPDNCENLQDCWKPAIELDKEPAIMVREPDATMQPAPQDNQLMPKHRVLNLEPHLRLERRGHGGQDETEKSDHSASLGKRHQLGQGFQYTRDDEPQRAPTRRRAFRPALAAARVRRLARPETFAHDLPRSGLRRSVADQQMHRPIELQLLDLLAEKRRAIVAEAITRGLDPAASIRASGINWLGDIPAHWEVERTRWLFRERDQRSIAGEEEIGHGRLLAFGLRTTTPDEAHLTSAAPSTTIPRIRMLIEPPQAAEQSRNLQARASDLSPMGGLPNQQIRILALPSAWSSTRRRRSSLIENSANQVGGNNLSVVLSKRLCSLPLAFGK